MTTEKDQKYKQYLRLLISYNDFQQAAEISELILSEEYYEKRNELRGHEGQKIRKLWEGLNCTMIIAYCRPFSGNDKKTENKIPDLSKNVLNCLTQEEKDLHKVIIEERNTILAHSDSEAWGISPQYLQMEGFKRKILCPVRRNVRAPFLPESVGKIQNMSRKLMEEIFERRIKLEEELKYIIPIQIIPNSNIG